MNDFIESLKRLYFRNKITNQKLNDMLTNKKLSNEEYKYIISKQESC